MKPAARRGAAGPRGPARKRGAERARPVPAPRRQRVRGRTVVVYYSRYGATGVIAKSIAQTLGCELREIRARRRRSWITMGLASVFNVRYRIEPMDFDFTGCGLVVLCAPIWASKPACPMMSFLDVARLQGTRSALVFSTRESGAERTVDAMKGILETRGSQVIASESIPTRRVPEDILRARAREFALELKKR